jgi:tetrathionate reductase subunit B
MTQENKEISAPRSNRRDFLKTVAGGVTGGAVAASGLTKASAASPKTAQFGMLIDLRKCVGCQACTVACKAEFDVPLGANRSWVEYVEKGTYPNVGRSFLPRLCNHCSEPDCVTVCPTNATYKRKQDGVVVVDTGVCIGCKYCLLACPYDARFLNPVTKFIDKCDFCAHRTAKGLVPSCVNTCPSGARVFGDLNDPESEISVMIAENPVSTLRSEMGTQPNVYYIDADHSDPSDPKRPGGGELRVITHRHDPIRR